jgi:uncharacterized protein YjbI with pentapeptide repeats
MRWEPDTQNPCDGTVGADALVLMAQRGSLSGIRSDLGTAFVPLPGRDYRAADLSSADLTNAMLRDYDFRCVNFRLATLRDTHLLRCDLRWADLRGATLRSSSIAASDLRHVNFGGADLRGVRFDVAQDSDGWRGCNLSEASLDEADLRGAAYRMETVWPDGFDPVAAGAEATR